MKTFQWERIKIECVKSINLDLMESRVTFGQVSDSSGSYMSNHGWCSVKVDGTWYISDYFAYMKTDSAYPRAHTERDGVYTLKITNGTVNWQ